MKTPHCKECKGTGTIHIENQWVTVALDIPCWICGGLNFKGMTSEQVKWYLVQYKALDALKSKSLRKREVVAPVDYLNLKNQINKACGRLGIALQNVAKQQAPGNPGGQTSATMFLRAEFNEYERRLAQIPVAVTNITNKKVEVSA